MIKMALSSCSTKLVKKKAMDKLSHIPKNIREVLRQRCREQLHEKRDEIFNSRRLGLTDQEAMNTSLTEIVRREISDMSLVLLNKSPDNVSMFDEDKIDIEEELMREHQYMMQKYEKMYQHECDMMNEYIEYLLKKEVICPVCQLTEVKETPEAFICHNCKLRLPLKMNIGELGTVIDQRVKAHNDNCSKTPKFTATPIDNVYSLELSCGQCSYSSSII